MTDGSELVGRIVQTPTRRGRIVSACRLLDMALVEIVDDHDRPTGGMGVLKSLKNIAEAA
jgi:hypothetical protein